VYVVYILLTLEIIQMVRPSQFQQAKSEITAFLDKQNIRIFTPRNMSDILYRGKRYWKLPESYSLKRFIEQATKNIDLRQEIIEFPHRSYTRYIWRKVSKYELYLSLVQNSYFTHQTALFLHQLIDAESKTIYLNFEQSKKPRPKGELSQEGIDMAFKSRQRTTKNIATFNNDIIYLLNGQHTNKTGVTKFRTAYGELDVTSLERTLIDVIVRPDYTESIEQILLIYKRAKDHISTEKMFKTLNQLNFIYPYHQVIGFLLEKSGINDPALLKPFRNLGLNFDFYLTRQMKNPNYSTKWKLYYPKNLISV